MSPWMEHLAVDSKPDTWQIGGQPPVSGRHLSRTFTFYSIFGNIAQIEDKANKKIMQSTKAVINNVMSKTKNK